MCQHRKWGAGIRPLLRSSLEREFTAFLVDRCAGRLAEAFAWLPAARVIRRAADSGLIGRRTPLHVPEHLPAIEPPTRSGVSSACWECLRRW